MFRRVTGYAQEYDVDAEPDQMQPAVLEDDGHASGGPERGPDGETQRLGIRHIMAWTGCVAFSLVTLELVWSDVPAMYYVFRIPHAVLIGTGILGLLVWLEFMVRGTNFFCSPGSWLVCAHGLRACMFFANSLLSVMTQSPEISLGVYVIAEILGVVIGIIAVVRSNAASWRPFLFVWTLSHVAGILQAGLNLSGIYLQLSLFDVARVIGFITMCFLALALIITISVEGRERRQWNWVHWLGVGLELVGIILTLGWSIVPAIVR